MQLVKMVSKQEVQVPLFSNRALKCIATMGSCKRRPNRTKQSTNKDERTPPPPPPPRQPSHSSPPKKKSLQKSKRMYMHFSSVWKNLSCPSVVLVPVHLSNLPGRLTAFLHGCCFPFVLDYTNVFVSFDSGEGVWSCALYYDCIVFVCLRL